MGVAFEKANHQYVEIGNRNNLTNYSNHIMASEVEAVPVPDEEVATGPDGEPDRKTSVGSGEIQLSKIQIILRPRSEDEEEEEVEEKRKKRTAGGKPEPTPAEVLTKTLAQALRLINEQKEKERQKQKKEEIRQMALAQKEKMEGMGAPRVILHC